MSSQSTSHPPTVRDLACAIEAFAPLSLAAPWDNAGLLVGSERRALDGPVVVTIDLNDRVLSEAIGLRASCVVAYHPPLFHPTRRIVESDPRQRVLLRAIQAGISIYSPHTTLDAAAGGMTDWLCEGISGSAEPGRIMGDVRALSPHPSLAETQQAKIVTFVPHNHAENVRNALASAGAGIIGGYTVCSFSCTGVGTFLGDPTTHPTIGQAGALQSIPETRLEMVCSKAALAVALETLRAFHPYEHPAIDIIELSPHPMRGMGHGRRLMLDRPATLVAIGDRLKAFLGVSMVKLACADHDDRAGTRTAISRVGVCPGAGADLAKDAIRERCELFVTGEMTYHEVIDCLNAGMSVMLAGHTQTERGFMPRLAQRIALAMPHLDVRVSQADQSPIVPH